MNNYAENKKQIEAIRNKAGEMMFRMAISHLMDVGIRHLTEELVEETCKKVMQEDDSKAFMTNEFKCGLIRMAYELAQIPHTDLLVYIQREVVYDIFDGMPSYERAIELLKSCIEWFTDDTDNKSIVKNLNLLDFEDDEITSLGYGWLFEEEEE